VSNVLKTTGEDKKYWIKKVEVLRAEENALRAEKSALRIKENKLLDYYSRKSARYSISM
jgi:hypothetical protein